ncbi:MAG: hypothetical protein J6Y39_04765 [Bacteroidaceae bacterium]|nr:hypothetical protein [Bacteroidaceae bacterium]
MTKRLLLALCLWVSVLADVCAQGYYNNSPIVPRKQEVWMFGVATSFTDSLMLVTDLQPVEAYILPGGFLANRTHYMLQLNAFLVNKVQLPNMTCVVFFDKKKSKAYKKYLKINKKYREQPGMSVQHIGGDIFDFQTEEWIETTVVETSPKEEQEKAANPSAAPTNGQPSQKP